MIKESISPVLMDIVAVPMAEDIPSNFTDPSTLHLFTAGPGIITSAAVVGDFTEAVFAGYAPVDIATADWSGWTLSQNGNAIQIVANVQFIAGMVVAPGETILGYYLTDSTDATLYYAEEFPQSWLVTTAGQVLDLLIQLPIFKVGSVN